MNDTPTTPEEADAFHDNFPDLTIGDVVASMEGVDPQSVEHYAHEFFTTDTGGRIAADDKEALVHLAYSAVFVLSEQIDSEDPMVRWATAMMQLDLKIADEYPEWSDT